MMGYDDEADDDYNIGPPGRPSRFDNSDIPDPDAEQGSWLTSRYGDRLPIPRHDENGEPFVHHDLDLLDEVGDFEDDPVPPFDMFNDFLGPQSLDEAEMWARIPDSSLNGLKGLVDYETRQRLHFYFLSVYDKHHGF